MEPKVGNAGIFKVVAPPEWNPREQAGSYRDFIDSKKFNVNKPIEQNVYGTKGVFEIVNFVQDSKNLHRFERTARTHDAMAHGKTDI